ncbi:pyridoxamine 5'-phosphate oxidase family protein [Streptomyces beihaiensis]|uniref:Pyridoxamine 5'-phosphate oxidase family protein n=1 Tax=Streptomyces beihaiensis TaxID=2984495 RepID=A0ABT3TMV9_9ACTN|nr:pyridoxamine 5'-phosphate oxidase family protein [Streptomyces beihaiensis]MCX3058388.1 pyridoxamine 5'-phosphate oxidase family protein [Streptomyces beihaiensis]
MTANANWASFTAAEPDLAKTVEARFGRYTHHTLATLRGDGSPRTSGMEVRFSGGELRLAMLPGSLKARDLWRDPRFALQANPGEGTSMGGGDIRIAGRAYEEEAEPPERSHLFRVELTEVVRTYVEDDKYLVVQVWKPGEPVRVIKRV